MQMTLRRAWQILALALVLALAASLAFKRVGAPGTSLPAPEFSVALEQIQKGEAGAARALYRQLHRDDLEPEQRAALYLEVANYPTPELLAMTTQALHAPQAPIRDAAIDSLVLLLPYTKAAPLLGPLLGDENPQARFHAVRVLLGASPDQLGLYFDAMQQAVDAYIQALQVQAPSAQGQAQLVRLYLYNANPAAALQVADAALAVTPDELPLQVLRFYALDALGRADQARLAFAEQLRLHPDSAPLQHELGRWLLSRKEEEYALLALARAVELAPDNSLYRIDLATTLHALEQLEPAQKQLDEVLHRQPANRRARALLITYWKETGQLQNVQVLLAQLEQQNPDDPLLE